MLRFEAPADLIADASHNYQSESVFPNMPSATS